MIKVSKPPIPTYRGVGTLDPRSRWVPPLGPVGTPDPMGISTKGDLYTYIPTYGSDWEFSKNRPLYDNAKTYLSRLSYSSTK